MTQFDRIFGSLSWSAYGDALSCCSEPSEGNLFSKELSFCEWKLSVQGVQTTMPIGSYSSDTQLRLAVCRSFGRDGTFDVESFSKVELTVWRSYAVNSAGGLKAAARSLLKPDVQWNSNFFSESKAEYLDQKGYEAAARIQPHVFSSPATVRDSDVLRPVIRNAILTHGHPVGFVSAAFHALCLCHALREGKVARVSTLKKIADNLEYLPALIRKDALLTEIWLSVWENKFGQPIEDAIKGVVGVLKKDLDELPTLTPSVNALEKYRDLLKLPCFELGDVNGIRTVVLAACLSLLSEDCPEQAMQGSLQSHHQGIATLAGDLLGLVSDVPPPSEVADLEYMKVIAGQLANLRAGKPVTPFRYPDLLSWQPPRAEVDYVGQDGNIWALAGLGCMNPIGKPIASKSNQDGVWQWFLLDFGQKVLLKRRKEVKPLDIDLMPTRPKTRVKENSISTETLDAQQAMQLVVASGFDNTRIGELIVRLGRQPDGLRQARQFAELLASNKRESPDGGISDLPLSRSALVERWTAGERFSFTFFYGHRPPSVGVDQSCFSQWFERQFSIEGTAYLTAEHWMMAEKARLFGDSSALERILKSRSPKTAKSAGRKVRGFDPQRWDEEKVRIVREGNIAKFSQNDDLRNYLLSTQGTVLVEAASNDGIWGIGLSRSDKNSKDPTHWQGENLLGFVLTEAREILASN